MKLANAHLSYCSNIHPGESWEQTFQNLKTYTTNIRKKITTQTFGVGLRLSNEAAKELLTDDNLTKFKTWLKLEKLYVFTINGFPYGTFHHKVIKDQVHHPDWSTTERFNYTKRLITILAELLPENISGSISTSPITYKYWHKTDKDIETITQKATESFIEITCHLIEIKQKTGKNIHLDIEPEPDGLLETSHESITYFNSKLIPYGVPVISRRFNFSAGKSEKVIKDHLQICMDICHFAVGYESPATVIQKFKEHDIKIGKLQISAALSSGKLTIENKDIITSELDTFDEPVYLHQAVIKDKSGSLTHYKDLGEALQAINSSSDEIRTHYHVPVFTDTYHHLCSTQSEIKEPLAIWKETPFTDHLEIETYTWSILPKELQLDPIDTIVREIDWVKQELSS